LQVSIFLVFGAHWLGYLLNIHSSLGWTKSFCIILLRVC